MDGKIIILIIAALSMNMINNYRLSSKVDDLELQLEKKESQLKKCSVKPLDKNGN